MKIETVHKIWESEFSDLVSEVYGRPYRLQQQGDCYAQDSIIEITATEEDYPDDWVPYEDEITLEKWLSADPNAPIRNPRYDQYRELALQHPGKGYEKLEKDEWEGPGTTTHDLYWEREFYPPLEDLVNDLCKKGKIPAGDYVIHVWW